MKLLTYQTSDSEPRLGFIHNNQVIDMEDFGEIARVTLGDDETDLEAEAAYTELVEFVRVSVQLVFEEFYDVRRGVTAASAR